MKNKIKWIAFMIIVSALSHGYELQNVYANESKLSNNTILLDEDTQLKDLQNSNNYLVLVLQGSIEEQSSIFPLFQEVKKKSLSYYLDIFKRVADDTQIHGLLLKIKNPKMTMVQRQEMIDGLTQIRQKGKKIIVFSQSFLDQNDYLIATVANEIYTTPLGGVFLKGMSIEIPFLKRTFDWLGIKANFVNKGNYKTSTEIFTRESASKYLQESMNTILDGLYNEHIQLIAKNKKKPESTVLEWFDESLFSSERAQKLGIIDGVLYEDELQDNLSQDVNLLSLDEDSLELKDWLNVKKLRELVMSLFMSDDTKDDEVEPNHIAVVHMKGAIVEGQNAPSIFNDTNIIDLDTYLPLLEDLADNDKVKAVVLRIDSPGGSALVSDLISRGIRKLAERKPVVASLGNMAASGGYYLAMSAPMIIANPYTITGSIGVISGKMSFRQLYHKLGVDKTIFKRGHFSGLDSEYSDYTDEEKKLIIKNMDNIYNQFIQKVSDYRAISLNQVKNYAQGKIYTGRQALQVKLVDYLGGFNDALDKAKELYLKEKKRLDNLEVIHYPAKPVFENLFKSMLFNTQGDLLLWLLNEKNHSVMYPLLQEQFMMLKNKKAVLDKGNNGLYTSCSYVPREQEIKIPTWLNLFKDESVIAFMPFSLCFK